MRSVDHFLCRALDGQILEKGGGGTGPSDRKDIQHYYILKCRSDLSDRHWRAINTNRRGAFRQTNGGCRVLSRDLCRTTSHMS